MVGSVTVFVAVSAPSFSFDFRPTALSKLSPKVLSAMRDANSQVPVLIETTSWDYGPVVNLIEAEGGTVVFQYEFTSSLAARIPSSALLGVAELNSVKAVYLDEIRQIADAGSGPGLPGLGLRGGAEFSAGPSGLQQAFPHVKTLSSEEIAEYAPEVFNLDLTNALGTADARTRAADGAGTTVAIIDTGIYSGHFMLTGSVVGGIDLSTDPILAPAFAGHDRVTNHWHGSHVAGIALGHGAFCDSASSLLILSIEQHTGVTLPACTIPGLEFLKEVPLLGMAPAAKTYTIKVFPHTGAGASTSTIIAGIEHAISKQNEFGIDVISMSLGGATLFDGRNLEDRTVDAAVSAGIVVVSAAGNEGPASMTVASPGSANKGMAVAAAAMPVNVRVFWDLFHGDLDAGNELFVSDDPQIIAFSSRGPTADGRGKPDVAAPGVFILSAFPLSVAPQAINFVSGTSMATPHTSGAALLLTGFAEIEGIDARPFDIKNALKESAEDLDLFNPDDFGSGLINVDEAMDDLESSRARFKVDLVGAQEVPPVTTDASGEARVRLRDDDSLRFKLEVCDIVDVTQSHIHVGPTGFNGPVAVFLFGPAFADPLTVDGCERIAKGELGPADLVPNPAVSDWDEFLEAFRNGNTYVNVHTEDIPTGEIRGQLSHADELGAESEPLADISNIDDDDDEDDSGAFVISDEEELDPGEQLVINFATDLPTSSIRLDIEDVDLGEDAPDGATWLSNFGFDDTGQPQMNSLEVYIHGAKRGGSFFDYEIDSANVWGDATFTVTDDATTAVGALRLDTPIKPFGDFNARMIEPGFYKIVIENDWTSFDEIEFEFTITVETAALPVPDVVFGGSLFEGDAAVFPLFVDPGTSKITFVLSWTRDWSEYPTNDLDFLVFGPPGTGLFGIGLLCLRFSGPMPPTFLFLQGATLNSPEVCVVDEPPTGIFIFPFVDGFSIPLGFEEEFTLEVFFD